MTDTLSVRRTRRPSRPRGWAALDQAVTLAEEIDLAGGLPALAPDDPRRRAFVLAVLHVAGLKERPMASRKVWTSIEHVTRYERAALAVRTEMLRRRRAAALGAAVARVREALAEAGEEATS